VQHSLTDRHTQPPLTTLTSHLPQALVTAVCWRPDGKQLAAGHANGAISILDVETGDVVSDNKVHYAAIATLQWSDQAGPPAASTNGGKPPAGQQLLAPQHSMLPHQRFKRLFAPPELSPFPPNSTEPLPNPYDMCMEAAGAASWPAERAGLSLLCAGDARGHISLWLQGQVQIAEVAGGVHVSEGEEGDSLAAAGPFQLVHVSSCGCVLVAVGGCRWMQHSTASRRGARLCVLCASSAHLSRPPLLHVVAAAAAGSRAAPILTHVCMRGWCVTCRL
jgi:hypothetical protein